MSGPALPSRLLFDPNRETQHQYVPAAATDVRVTFNRWRAQQSDLGAQLAASLKPVNVKQLRRGK